MTQTIKFLITPDKADEMTWEELEALEQGKISQARKVMARFLVDEDDQPVEIEQAMFALGKLKMSEIKQAVKQFADAMSTEAVNPTKKG